MHTWPLASDPASLSRHDNSDAYLNEWTIAWVAHQTPRDPAHLFDANIFYPERRTLAFGEHLFVPSMLAAPILWVGRSPVLAFNLLLIAGFALTGWTVSLAIQRWTGDWSAGLVAGALVAFNAHTLTRLPHVQALHAEFLPLALVALDDLMVRQSIRDALRLAGWFTLQALCSGYLLLFSAIAIVAGILVRPADWTGRNRRRVAMLLSIAGALSVAATLPFLWPYYLVRQEQGMVRTLAEASFYGATIGDYLATAARLHFDPWSHRFYRYNATALFPGIAALALTGAALLTGVAVRDRRARMLIAIGAAGFVLSFGPAEPLYRWLYRLFPLMEAARNSARFGYLALVAVGGLAAFGLAAVRARVSPATGRRIAVAALLVVTLEALRAPMAFTRYEGISHVYDALAREEGGIAVEFPFFPPPDVAMNGRYVFASTRHWKPLLNGYDGFTPASYERHHDALREFPGTSALDYLRQLGVTHVILHADEVPNLAAAVQRVAALVPIASDETIRLYRLEK